MRRVPAQEDQVRCAVRRQRAALLQLPPVERAVPVQPRASEARAQQGVRLAGLFANMCDRRWKDLLTLAAATSKSLPTVSTQSRASSTPVSKVSRGAHQTRRLRPLGLEMRAGRGPSRVYRATPFRHPLPTGCPRRSRPTTGPFCPTCNRISARQTPRVTASSPSSLPRRCNFRERPTTSVSKASPR